MCLFLFTYSVFEVVTLYMEVRGHVLESVPSFYCVGPRDQIQVLSLASKSLYLPSHLSAQVYVTVMTN